MSEYAQEIRELATTVASIGQIRIKCPACSPLRKKKNEKALACNLDGESIVYHCHHCNIEGAVKQTDRIPIKANNSPKPVESTSQSHLKITGIQSLSDKWLSWLEKRGISKATAESYGVVCGERMCNGRTSTALGFPYRMGDNLVAVKWRNERKDWTQDGAARSFFGVDNCTEDEDYLVIVEGELDVLALAEAGVPNVVSVPNGAPAKVSSRTVSPEEDKKFSYVWGAKEFLDKWDKVIIAGDTDDAGIALSEELARRIGKAKCYKGVWADNCKDGNETLLKHGSEIVRNCIEQAEPFPLTGLYDAEHYSYKVGTLYEKGMASGESTGYPSLDKLYTIARGQLTIVTGVPSSGKSEFVDQLTVNLAKNKDWKFAMCSFENPPELHIAKLAEKYSGKPFFKGLTERMDPTEVEEALTWVQDHYVFVDHNDGTPATIDSILEKMQAAVMRNGARGIVVDPFNYIQQQGEESQTSQINNLLTKIQLFCRANEVHCWFICHPQKLPRTDTGRVPIPKGYDISGSAHFFNKADIGLTVHRADDVEIHIWKVRFKWIGGQGFIGLNYDIATGRYIENFESTVPDDYDWTF